MDAPLIEVVESIGRRAPSCPEDYSAEYLSDWVRLDTLILTGRLTEAAEMCRERLLVVEGERRRLRWVKDLATVRRAQGMAETSLDLMASHYTAAVRYGDTLTAKFENGLGVTYERLGRTDKAFDHYEAARYYHEREGNRILTAETDNNIGCCLVSAGNPSDSEKYFKRAMRAARREGDSRLVKEVHESLSRMHAALALKGEG